METSIFETSLTQPVDFIDRLYLNRIDKIKVARGSVYYLDNVFFWTIFARNGNSQIRKRYGKDK